MTSSLHDTDSSPHPARAGDCRGVVRLKCSSGLKTGELTHKIDGNPTCDFSKARFVAIHFQMSCCGRPGRLLSLHLPARMKEGKARDRTRKSEIRNAETEKLQPRPDSKLLQLAHERRIGRLPSALKHLSRVMCHVLPKGNAPAWEVFVALAFFPLPGELPVARQSKAAAWAQGSTRQHKHTAAQALRRERCRWRSSLAQHFPARALGRRCRSRCQQCALLTPRVTLLESSEGQQARRAPCMLCTRGRHCLSQNGGIGFTGGCSRSRCFQVLRAEGFGGLSDQSRGFLPPPTFQLDATGGPSHSSQGSDHAQCKERGCRPPWICTSGHELHHETLELREIAAMRVHQDLQDGRCEVPGTSLRRCHTLCGPSGCLRHLSRAIAAPTFL